MNNNNRFTHHKQDNKPRQHSYSDKPVSQELIALWSHLFERSELQKHSYCGCTLMSHSGVSSFTNSSLTADMTLCLPQTLTGESKWEATALTALKCELKLSEQYKDTVQLTDDINIQISQLTPNGSAKALEPLYRGFGIDTSVGLVLPPAAPSSSSFCHTGNDRKQCQLLTTAQ